MKYIFILTLFFSLNANAQFSASILDYNNVSATVSDGGVLFTNPGVLTAGYEIPKGSGINSIFSSAFWFGGLDYTGQLHLSGTRYTGAEDIFPGPISDSGMYTSPDYTNAYASAIWSVYQAEIDDHILNWNQPGYTVPSSIANWPGNGNVSIGVAEQLAPYVDVNNNNVYEPALGDYPNIRGDEAVYIIMNDAAELHLGSGGDQLGIEVHLMLYQYATTDFKNNTTFINMRVINRGTTTYPDFRTTYYVDADLGGYADDYVGCDSSRNLIFTYNGDENDESTAGSLGYGANPPAIGVVSLSTLMSGAGYYTSNAASTQTDPTSAGQYWNYMNNTWRFGEPWVYGGTGFSGSTGSTSTLTSYLFGGELGDSTEWSESSMNNPAGDRRMLMNLDSTSLAPGQMICYDLAVVYGEGIAPFGSVTDLKNNADLAKSFFDGENFSCQTVAVGNEELSLLKTSIYPNPSSGNFHISIQQPVDQFTVNVLDLSGRIVFSQEYENQQEIDLDLQGHKGVYIVQVESSVGSAVERVLIE